jgi:cytochrome c peroxidase
LDLYRPYPHDNQPSPAKAELGRLLFHERKLSRDGSMSCATCHDPARAFTDGQVTALGVDGTRGSRNVPTILNSAWGTAFFWDGRASTLEQQVLQPIFNPRELAAAPAQVVAVAQSVGYRGRFIEVFGSEPSLGDVARALASYVRTIVAGDSPFDRYMAGETRALSEPAIRGLALFRGRAGCRACHAGPTFADGEFHNTGIAWRTGVPTDEGRALVTRAAEDRGAFKTPTLREVTRTAPYMHDGSVATLAEVIDYYDGGGHENPTLDRRMRRLHLSTSEKKDLLAFLQSLDGIVTDGSRSVVARHAHDRIGCAGLRRRSTGHRQDVTR